MKIIVLRDLKLRGTNNLKCNICPHNCVLSDNESGFCGGRNNYGKITALSLDPIEKKPLRHFYPSNQILSVGSYGCNLRCGFCQNHRISINGEVWNTYITPDELANKSVEFVASGNIGVAYTYNEPLIGYEYVLDCAKAVHYKGLKNVLVTNGYINEKPLLKLLPHIDAMNIDLKGFTTDFYKRICGDLEVVKNTIRLANKFCHLEVTTLIIPIENDNEEEIGAIAKWLASVNNDIPYHISRFLPNYKYSDIPPVSVEKIYKLAGIAKEHLSYVYCANC